MNRKWLFILITLLSLTFFSHATFADDPCQGTSTHIFNNICYSHDASYRLLYEFFAPKVDAGSPLPWPWAQGDDNIPKLPNTTSTQNAPTNSYLAPLFKTFNQAMLSLAAIVILYTLFTALLGATHRGEFMGGKAHSMWLPLRSVAGFVMIIPTVSGYSLIQLCMLWVILQGVSLANSLVQRTLVPPVIHPIVDTSQFTYRQHLTNLEKNIACTYDKYYPLSRSPYSSLSGGSTILTPTVLSDSKFYCNSFIDKATQSGYTFNFWLSQLDPTQDPQVQPCCAISATPDNCPMPSSSGWVLYQCGDVHWPTTNNYTVPPSSSVSISMNGLFKPIYATILNTSFAAASNDIDYENGKPTSQPPSPYAGKNIQAIFAPALTTIHDTINAKLPSETPAPSPSVAPLLQEGWATAGAYFYQALNPSSSMASYPSIINLDNIGILIDQCISAINNTSLTKFLTTFDASSSTAGQNSSTVGQNASAAGQSVGTTATTGGGGLAIDVIQFAIKIIAPGPDQTPTIGIGSNHPLIRIQILGQYILGILTAIIALMTAAAFVAGLVSHIVSAVNPVWGVWDTLIKIFTAPAEILAGLAYAGAISMTIYIPMIPYIIFSFGVIGWLIAVLETLLAAPLVAMGLTYPEGHEMWGKADPALMLLANVFLRPAFMIFGLFAGIVVSQIAIWFINDTILTFITGVLSNPGTVSSLGFFGQLISVLLIPFYIAIYVLLIITILNRSFALISIIPDQILKWIGGQTQLGEYAPKGAEEVKQGFAPMASKAASGVGSAAPAASSYGGAIGKELHKDKPKETDTAAVTVK
ncbi:MAG: hypothetical protein A2X77_01725 [Gammaproteobacteria bacterium GWE2_42_36]|nr:MAG: hypothetical protein A2X77_01725 [Gammaproteobacteria bacterium GWE2_42_36]HCU05452.1 hypothetical protein [Coxiellaceae bacterium]